MKFKSDKEKQVVEKLIENKVIPEKGNFEISQNIIDSYYNVYNRLYSTTGKENRNNNIKYAKKLAALTLMNLNRSRGDEVQITKKKVLESINSGFLYIISNPAFEGFYKIGITKELNNRLATYQTYDPLRRYKIEHSTFCSNVRDEEKRIIDKFSIDVKNGEWVKASKAQEIYKEIKSLI